MTIAVGVLAIALVLTIVVASILLTPSTPGPWSGVERRRVIVSTTAGHAFRGVLWETTSQYLVLRDAELLQEDRAVPVDGDVIVERPRTAYVQVLP